MPEDTDSKPARREARLVLAAVIIAAATFAVDLLLPLGVAGGALYTVLVLLGLWSERPRFIIILAVTATLQTAAGAVLSPPGSETWVWVVNRLLTTLAVWVIASFLLVYLRTRRKLRRTEVQAQAYLEVAEIIMLVLDRDGCIRLINRKGCEVLGCDPGEAHGRNWFRTFLPEGTRGEIETVFRQLMAGEVEPVEYYENPVLRVDGDERMVAWHNTVLRDDAGKVTGVLSSGEDVTERRQAQDQQRRQESLARLGQMAAVVAHELRNPIAGISGAIQILGNRMPAGSQEKEVATDILKRLESLKHMSQDLLLFARPRDPRFEPVNMQALLRSAANLLASDPDMNGIQVDITGPDLSVSGDPELLTNLFLNLMLNAAHAMDGRGRITLAVDDVDESCHIEVKDEGPGIPAEVRGQIFEPFFSTKHRGTGLGLAIARKVVEAHGGAISVECPSGGGTTVLVRLPR